MTDRDTVAIFGCSGVGLGAVAASAFRGAITIAIDVDDEKLAIARLAGATHTVHSQRQSLAPALAAITGEKGPDVVIEAGDARDISRRRGACGLHWKCCLYRIRERAGVL